MRVKLLLAVAGVLLTIHTSASIATAQVPTGTISGRVLDQSGQAVPGVTVTPGRLYLDELMIKQCAGRLFGDRVRETLFTEADHGIQWVRQAAQIAALSLR